jgi:hypothetical protein
MPDCAKQIARKRTHNALEPANTILTEIQNSRPLSVLRVLHGRLAKLEVFSNHRGASPIFDQMVKCRSLTRNLEIDCVHPSVQSIGLCINQDFEGCRPMPRKPPSSFSAGQQWWPSKRAVQNLR